MGLSRSQAIIVHLIYQTMPFTIIRNSSGDETMNVNFLYDDIVHIAYYKIQ